jgi:hypothetical protein
MGATELLARLFRGFFDAGGAFFHNSVSCLGAAVAAADDILPPARSNTSLSACTSLCPALTMRARASACSQSDAGGGSTGTVRRSVVRPRAQDSEGLLVMRHGANGMHSTADVACGPNSVLRRSQRDVRIGLG